MSVQSSELDKVSTLDKNVKNSLKIFWFEMTTTQHLIINAQSANRLTSINNDFTATTKKKQFTGIMSVLRAQVINESLKTKMRKSCGM